MLHHKTKRPAPLISEPPQVIWLVPFVLIALGLLFFWQLTANRSKATFSVNSLSGMLKLTVDGKDLGEASTSSQLLAAGEKTVILQKNNPFYAPFERKIDFIANEQTTINWELGPVEVFSAGEIITTQKEQTEISVISEPNQARVAIDGQDSGMTPLIISAPAEGKHTIRVSKDGYLSREINVTVRNGFSTQLDIRLFPVPLPAEITKISEEGFTGIPRVNFMARYDWKCDETLSDQNKNQYRPVNRMVIYNLSVPDAPFGVETTDWVKGIYYYNVVHQGLNDTPFHYFIDSQGKIFEGKKGGCSATVALSDILQTTENACLVGYLGRYGEDLTPAAQTSFRSLLEKSESPVFGANVFQPSPLSGDSGTTQTITLEYTNIGSAIWYAEGEQAVALKPQTVPSAFFVKDLWSAQDKVATTSARWILPNEKAQFQLPLRLPAEPGEYTEKFGLYATGGDNSENLIPGSEITITVTVKGEKKTMVKIRETGTGFLRVRSGPSKEAAEVDKVKPGEIYQLLAEQNGWAKIRYGENKEGWVSADYIERL